MGLQGLLQYGNWSGPGWTAGKRDDPFKEQHADRILSDDDRAMTGIDAYDGFVAKAHDMNEYAAQAVLRQTLGDLELIDNKTTQIAGSPAYAHQLVLSQGGEERKRFVSFHHYRDALAQSGPSDEARGTLGFAFSLYYRHVALSNQQFALDYTLNRPSLLNMLADLSSLEFTLAFGPHLFLKEAAVLIDQAARTERESGIAAPSAGEWLRHLQQHFVYPQTAGFQAGGAEVYVPALALPGLAAISHAQVTGLFQKFVDATDRNTRANRIYHRYRPQGARDVRDALLVLHYPG